MKLSVWDSELLGGSDIDIEITKSLIDTCLAGYGVVYPDTIEQEVDHCIEFLVTELNLENRHATDNSLFTLAVLLECLNASDDCDELDKNISENTPFDSYLSGFVMIVLCQLEAKGFIYDTKYCRLTDKGKLLLWLLRRFEFEDTDI